MEQRTFTYFDSKNVQHSLVIGGDDLTFVQRDKDIKDQKLQRKPTTFFKDAIKRFRKNKSSVAGAIVLGFLLILTIFVPFISQSDIDTVHSYETFLEPKLFGAGFGFWDGCKDYTNIAVDVDWDHYEETGEITGLPAGFAEKDIVGGNSGVTMTKIGENYTTANQYGHGGFARLSSNSATTTPTLRTPYAESVDLSSDLGYTIDITVGDPADYSDWTFGDTSPYTLSFSFLDAEEVEHTVPLVSGVSDFGSKEVKLYDHVAKISQESGGLLTFAAANEPRLVITLDEAKAGTDPSNVIIESLVCTATDATANETFSAIGFVDANEMVVGLQAQGQTNPFRIANAQISAYHVDIIYSSFRFDTYEHAYGNYQNDDITLTQLQTYKDRGWISIDLSLVDGYEYMTRDQRTAAVEACAATLEVLDVHSPIVHDADHPFTGRAVSGGGIVTLTFSGTVTRWRELYLGRDSMPSFLFGTDASGRDMWKYVFTGLRTSLMLGIISFVVCFTFGLCWGAIAGYFGGWTDILMERFVEILSGVPWIVVMTLAMIQFGQNMLTFGVAICLTGWISTSGITRTQFYRYKDREYILAARSLGAKDRRLIFRHILPNAMGTIITSSVLMIPSVIYSEATISYLGLGLQDQAALGVILSENQKYIGTYSHLILFPSVVMAFIMISFNLFGNGLRDAFNPSLKGQE